MCQWKMQVSLPIISNQQQMDSSQKKGIEAGEELH